MGSIFSVNKTIEKCETKEDPLLVIEKQEEKAKKKENCGKVKRENMLIRL